VAVDKVVSVHHFSDTLTTCLVFEGGDIYIIREEDDISPQDEPYIEVVGSIDAGITAAKWSPDEELLVITTKLDTVIFMGRSFDPVAEAAMTAEDLKLSKHVSVGWGKRETQFQGKGAKALRDPTIPEKVDEGILSSYDDHSTSISWRGDGAFVAINSIEGGARRAIRVFTRDGVLDSISEPVDGLEGTLAWRPAGNLIAGVQRLSDRVNLVFFERNGLRHGQFTLRTQRFEADQVKPIHLEWNADSTVLAVVLADILQLWTMGNYHWYLKQEIPIGSGFSGLAWHPEKALQFACATSGLIIRNS
jgi:elongator complex protein 1